MNTEWYNRKRRQAGFRHRGRVALYLNRSVHTIEKWERQEDVLYTEWLRLKAREKRKTWHIR